MATNISNLPISSSFQSILLESASVVQNATGSVINNLTVTASYAITASHATNIPATASHALTAVSASFATTASFAVSASHEITKEISSSFADTASLAFTANYAETVSGSNVIGSVLSASFADSASQADSASFATLAGDAEEIVIAVKSSQATTILTGQTLHAVGVTGENVDVITASADIPANMPAIGLAKEDISPGSAGTAVISGKILGVDTDGLTPGEIVYVNNNGGFTSTKPTGSSLIQNIGVVGKANAVEGQLIVLGSGRSNDLPNITSGYAWVGNENQVPTAVSTASFNVDTASYVAVAALAENAEKVNIYTQNQNFEYRILFGISGSKESVYVDDAGNFNYNPSNNRLYNLNSIESTNFTGSLLGTASFADNATSASHVVSASFANNASSASVATNADSASNADRAVTASIADDIKQDINVVFNTGSFQLLTAQSASIGFLQSITGSAKIIGDAFIILNNDLPAERFAGVKVIDTGSTDATASLIWDGNTNDWKYDFSASGDADSAVVLFGPHADTITDTRYPEDNYLLKGTGTHHLASSSNVDNASTVTIGNTTTFSNGASGSFSGSFEGNGSEITGIVSASHAESASVATIADTAITASHIVTASFADRATSASIADLASTLSPTATASFADSATSASQADNASSASNAINAITASNVNTLNQNVQITGSVFVSGSVQGRTDQLVISSTTASFDPNEANYYELTLAGGADTHVTLTSIPKSHTMNLMVKQGGTTGTLSWNTNYFKFPGGTQFTGSQVTDTQDILSFVSFASSSVYYGTAISDVK